MELKILSEKANPLFSRKEVTAQVTGFTASPSRTEVLSLMAGQLKVDATAIHIHTILCPYGGVTAKVSASVYKDEAELKKHTPAKRMLRGIKQAPKKK